MRKFQLGVALFILTPILEIYLFIEIGSEIGALSTIALIALTAIVGVALIRYQGLSTLQNVQRQMQQGQIPAVGLLEGIMLFFAGALLLTPGFFTDTLGFIILIPPIRKSLALWILERSGTIVKMDPGQPRQADSNHLIEGELQDKDDRK
ncbi:FxsA protein [hydrothermal vent metagenome]|uniref:FxsA protein n=1 Tax=hydrothermal vent metagenome TaxID=652676 RepID=A0A3B1A9Q6_9ZZZZ